jgi:hypothetical protein
MADKKTFVTVLTCLFVLNILFGCAALPPNNIENPVAVSTPKTPVEPLTFEKYGKNIIYHSFFKIPKNLNFQKEILLPKDLKNYLDNPIRDLKITNPLVVANPQRFKEDLYLEMAECGYSIYDFRKMNAEEMILAAVKITCSKIEYGFLDENEFKQKYGRRIYIDDNFHFGIGDCDKYADLTITIFNFIKNYNPGLKNVYLCHGDLGGNLYTEHMWVAVLIVQENSLILSHIDPTFYDVGRRSLKKLLADDDWYITLKNDIFKACFYRELETGDLSNLLYAYEVFKKAYNDTIDKRLQEQILEQMNLTAFRMATRGQSQIALQKNEWVMNQYIRKEFSKHFGQVLVNNFWIYKWSGNKKMAEQCKQELREKYPKALHAINRKSNKE